jgi:hypothetical protein
MLADRFSPKTRATVYTVLAFISAVLPILSQTFGDGFDMADIPVLLFGFASAAGFRLATVNVPTVESD